VIACLRVFDHVGFFVSGAAKWPETNDDLGKPWAVKNMGFRIERTKELMTKKFPSERGIRPIFLSSICLSTGTKPR
jgi:hypothetical protein